MSVSGLLSLAVAAAVVALLLFLVKWLRQPGTLFVTVYEWEHALRYVNGRFDGLLPAGRHVVASPFSRIDVMTLRKGEQAHASAVVDLTSADKLVFRASAHVTYRIVNPRDAYEGVHLEKIGLAAQHALVRVAGERSVEGLLGDRPGADVALLEAMHSPVYGCEILSVTLNSVALPPELRRLFVAIEQAKLEAQAALERARGEHAALRSLANAAGMLKGNPELMNLRVLQALSQQSGKGQFTLVLGPEAGKTAAAAGA